MMFNKFSADISNDYSIAVLITSYNRVNKTLNCITKLIQLLPNCSIYLVDDNSSDVTVELIKKNFPQVYITIGDGNLFWNRGMNLAWKIASKNHFDFFLWLNDDVILYENSIAELLTCSTSNNHVAIISGIIETEDRSSIIYGGTDFNNRLIQPSKEMQAIKNLNGNVVLVPNYVFLQIGNLDPSYHHDLGDVDYGYRARQANIKVLTTRIPIAHGYRNDLCRVRLNNTTIFNRFKKLYSPLGANPFIIYYFRKKYFGRVNACLYFIFLHFLNLIPDFMNQFLFKKRYQ